jgi:glycosidase
VGDAFLVGEVYLRSDGLAPYMKDLDAAFSFELFHAPWTASTVRAALQASAALGEGRAAWVLSNHDFPRLPQRVGARNVRAAALLLLSLPGAAFVFQGDEIGMGDGPGRPPGTEPDDRSGRDVHRHPMAWDASEHGGFTTGTPWLPVVDPAAANVADQERDPGSLLYLYRDLIALRRDTLRGPLALIEDTAPGVLAFMRGDKHLIALNLGDAPAPAPAAGAVLRHTHDLARTGAHAPTLAPGEGFIATTA